MNACADFIRALSPCFRLLERYFRFDVVGLRNIPTDGPALLVLNHGVIPFHSFLLVHRAVTKLGILPRSLVAGFLFRLPVIGGMFLKGGAVNASRRNAERLLKEGQLITVAPGGIQEALVTEPGMRSIAWENRTGYAEVACRRNVPIIPTYCRGISDVFFTSRLFLKQREDLLKTFRFSLPLFFGIGLLPLPIKLSLSIGKPIPTNARRGEFFEKRVLRIHARVLAAVKELRDHTRH